MREIVNAENSHKIEHKNRRKNLAEDVSWAEENHENRDSGASDEKANSSIKNDGFGALEATILWIVHFVIIP